MYNMFGGIMDIDNLLNKVKFNLKLLDEYGFIKENDKYIYSDYIMNGDFRVDITIYNNKLTSKVFDSNTNYEYYSVYIKDNVGEFVGKVREEYYNLIKNIVDNCSSKELFNNNQTNRLATYIILKYKSKPEFLWDKTPDCAVFRHKENNKWFGIIMQVDRYKLDNRLHQEVEVLNIKLDPSLIEKLLNVNGFYKAYHMNGKYWISIILDETITDKVITELIDKSFILTK